MVAKTPWQKLIQEGFDITHDDYTPLFAAAQHEQEGITQMMIRHGFKDFSMVEAGRGDTALTLAAKAGHEGITRLLLEHDVHVEAFVDGERTPLLMAAWRGHEDIVSLLLEKGGDIDAVDSKGRNALWHAADGGHIGVVKILLNRLDPSHLDIEDSAVITSLFHAVGVQNERAVKLLLKVGVQMCPPDYSWSMEYLLQRDLGLNIPFASNDFEIERAKKQGYERVIKMASEMGNAHAASDYSEST
ncbi:ankyrin repeat-containing domain protein [Aspergillus pseudoustus]|uniref:Ankyrin repeat-containing domain protein n=1 Tax=Aspergillus pseudoustus TaxID=1810923 RepID=A0ABR4J6F1_9EURO